VLYDEKHQVKKLNQKCAVIKEPTIFELEEKFKTSLIHQTVSLKANCHSTYFVHYTNAVFSFSNFYNTAKR